MYGPFKAWTDAIRSFSNGELAALNNSQNIADQYPKLNSDLGLPFANPPPPANNSELYPVNRFWSESPSSLPSLPPSLPSIASYLLFFSPTQQLVTHEATRTLSS